MAYFTLTIHKRTSNFGGTVAGERNMVASLLRLAAQQIGSGIAPTPLRCGDGHEVAEYSFGPGMLLGNGEIDPANMTLPSAQAGLNGTPPKRIDPKLDITNGRITHTFVGNPKLPMPWDRVASSEDLA